MRIVINVLDLFFFFVLLQDILLIFCLLLNNYEDVVVFICFELLFDEIYKDRINFFVFVIMIWGFFFMVFLNCGEYYVVVVVCGGFLYVVGDFGLILLSCFNLKQNKWSIFDIKLNCKGCIVIFFDDEFFVIGGEDFWYDV